MSKKSYRGEIFSLFILIGIITGCNVTSVQNNQQQYFSVPTSNTGNVIARENALQGTLGWQIPAGKGATTQIQAYANATSVQTDETITFMVSTQVEGTPYSLGIYRLGWYGGLGGRLKFLLSDQIGHEQGYYDIQKHALVNCLSCHKYSTGLIEANWRPSYTLTIPNTWVTGVYLAKFADASGMQTYVPFDVRGNEQGTYVFVTSDTTYQAYNQWGGLSLYEADNGTYSEGNKFPRAFKVSFDRPYSDAYGSSNVLLFEADALRWMERQGYDLSYMSSVDLHEHSAALLQHQVYLSVGHDEYWTKEMREGVESARNHGVSLGFFGANEIYWQMRFEPDSSGAADRTIICYKVETAHNDLYKDPFYGKDNSRVTAQWRDPVLNRPENSLVGIMYSDLTHQRNGFPWRISSNASSSLLNGTGLKPGDQYGCGLIGYEWDRIFQNGQTPSNLRILAQSPTINNDNNVDFSNTTYYIASSGAIVFAAGSIYWTAALDTYRFYSDPLCKDQELVNKEMQKFMEHIMDALVTHHI